MFARVVKLADCRVGKILGNRQWLGGAELESEPYAQGALNVSRNRLDKPLVSFHGTPDHAPAFASAMSFAPNHAYFFAARPYRQ
jgi:hypothetical protein